MENDERWVSNSGMMENLTSRGGLQRSAHEASRSIIDPANVPGATTRSMGLRPRLMSNSMVPTTIEPGSAQPRLTQRVSTKSYTEFLPRASDDEGSNISIASVYDDRSNSYSSDEASALRENANGRVQKILGNGSFVPDGKSLWLSYDWWKKSKRLMVAWVELES